MHRNELWNKCVGPFNPHDEERLVNITWNVIKDIKNLTSCNPFMTDSKGVFLRNTVLTGCITEKHGKYVKQTIKYTHSNYRDQIVDCIDDHMYRCANLWNSSVISNFWYPDGISNRVRNLRIHFFPIQAQNIVINLLLINKRLVKQNEKDSIIYKYGLFPREIMNIIIGHVLNNYIDHFIISNESLSQSLNTITIPYIKNIGYSTCTSKEGLSDDRFANKRKGEIIENVVSEFSKQRKKIKLLKTACNSLPDIIGYIICKDTSADKESICDILNPKIKPFMMIGRKSINDNFALKFDEVNLDCAGFREWKKISRNHIKVRYNPYIKKIQLYFIGRNRPMFKENLMEYKTWTTVEDEDEITQPNADMIFSFHLYKNL
jgi:hypothetical protein